MLSRRPFPRRALHTVRSWLFRLSAAGAFSLASCEPELVVGRWECASPIPLDVTSAADFRVPDVPVELPWATGFEDGFCDYLRSRGFCYHNVAASYAVVDSPVHSGVRAAAYTISGEEDDALQARCVAQGELARAAYYGAWFYMPEVITRENTWNLFHFEGRDRSDPNPEEQHGLWDVSVRMALDGSLRVYVYDFLRDAVVLAPSSPEIVPEQWFHLEVYFERANDPSGTFTLWVDGQEVISLEGLITDDSELGQWFVGNFAADIAPQPNTLFVDDVTIHTMRQGAD